MKYIDAEKLKEHISRLRDEFMKKSETKGYTTLEYRHKAEGLSLALQHIESLEKEQPAPDFDTEVYNWLREHGSDETRQLIEMTARHFWEMAQTGGAMLHIADKSYKMGRRDERMEMMKDAVEGFIEEPEYLLWKLHLEHDLEGTFVAEHNLRDGDKVKVIILKAEDEK